MLQAQVAFALHQYSTRSPYLLPTKYPPILRLPVELVVMVFRHCSSDIKARLSLSHTCGHWMSIMSETCSLWADIQIIVNRPAQSRQFDNFISLLEIQLDRAARMPLNVLWESNQPSAFDPRLINLLRRKGPFSQWRTLRIRFGAVHPDDASIFHPGDAFSNLESLQILPSVRTSIIEVLNRTTTSKLQVLDHHLVAFSDQVTTSDCSDMMRRICRLKTNNTKIRSLPTNITQLDAPHQISHVFPHLRTYNAQMFVLKPNSLSNFQRLKTLNTTGLLIMPGTDVSLPSLRHLTCGTIYLKGATRISTPLLESMRISGSIYRDFTGNSAAEAIRNHGFPFSPSCSITVESDLPFDIIMKLLERSQGVERISLGFRDEEWAVWVLECIGGAGAEVGSEGVRLCGQLRELRLTFSWRKCHVRNWKERSGRVIKNRMGNGVVLRIYAIWKGEGAYMLLA